MVDQVERLGVVTGLGADPLSPVGLVAPVIGSGISLTWLSLSMVAGVVTLVIGMTGNIDCPFNCLKNHKNVSWHLLQSSSAVLQPEAQNEKVKTLV